MEYTPLPWEEDTNNPGYIIAKECDDSPLYVAGVYDRPGKCNIELILRAVNSHNELLEALQRLFAICLKEQLIPDTVSYMQAAEKAIAKATEE